MPIRDWSQKGANTDFGWHELSCYESLVCHNLAFRGDSTPVLAKHSKYFSLEDTLSIGVDRVQRKL